MNGWIHLWNLDTPLDAIPMLNLEAHDKDSDSGFIPFNYLTIDIVLSPDGRLIHSLSRNGVIRIWNTQDRELISEINLNEASIIRSIQYRC